MFCGLCAFPLSPLLLLFFDVFAFFRFLARHSDAGVVSLGIFGSTGCFA
ncbi:dihydrodipicolinate synthase family protein, partial [Klebsiella pneumoniae]